MGHLRPHLGSRLAQRSPQVSLQNINNYAVTLPGCQQISETQLLDSHKPRIYCIKSQRAHHSPYGPHCWAQFTDTWTVKTLRLFPYYNFSYRSVVQSSSFVFPNVEVFILFNFSMPSYSFKLYHLHSPTECIEASTVFLGSNFPEFNSSTHSFKQFIECLLWSVIILGSKDKFMVGKI